MNGLRENRLATLVSRYQLSQAGLKVIELMQRLLDTSLRILNEADLVIDLSMKRRHQVAGRLQTLSKISSVNRVRRLKHRVVQPHTNTGTGRVERLLLLGTSVLGDTQVVILVIIQWGKGGVRVVILCEKTRSTVLEMKFINLFIAVYLDDSHFGKVNTGCPT